MVGSRSTDRSWASSLKEELERVARARKEAHSRGQGPKIFKVPPYIRTLKPYHYNCQLLCLGLYNRDFVGLDRVDELRLEVVSGFLEQAYVQGPDRWDTLCNEIAGPVEESPALRHLYDDDPKISPLSHEQLRHVLTLDAVFLVALMSYWYFNYTFVGKGSLTRSRNANSFWSIFDQVHVNSHIALLFCDIWLFENQIPLFLIQKVWNLVYGQDVNMNFDNFLHPIVHSAVATFNLGYSKDHGIEQVVTYEQCDHLLGCLYNFVCSKQPRDPNPPTMSIEDNYQQSSSNPGSDVSASAQISGRGSVESSSKNSNHLSVVSWLRRVFYSLKAMLTWIMRVMAFRRSKGVLPRTQSSDVSNLLSVSELEKAGISVKGVHTPISGMRFVKSSFYFRATLLLPRIDIDDNTERMLRNMCAYELATETDHRFMCYLAVMDALIDSPDDVRLLRKGAEPVIALNYLGDDRDVALLFNNVLQKLSVRFSDEVKSLFTEVHDWYSSPIRHQVTRFVSRFQERPWLFISLVAANILFILTGLQTVYTMLSYYHP
ncbi:hypothetical protein MPTK1_1g28210 [Marchantia polymorpha subsp. ruderalis]|nr:hypothetical protein MARPO_0002s0057 [Marchantia polymorpha]BBN00327.1 hypothetical protein Mp_1g28210 [Marchantia polymorpha subsp. ruderalis]|eukprot:PTQ49555.1 hypothetical protein MARPO_0002s0057 [Marchantia polymorpha]